MAKFTLIILVMFGILNLFGRKAKSDKELLVVFYNVENLFDYKDDTNSQDDDYQPEGKLRWDEKRFLKKINDLTKVFTSIDITSLPAIIGLCEIENKNVLEELISKTALKDGNYGIIHKDSPDERGVDVGLLYRKDLISCEKFEHIEVIFPSDINDRTRDILYFCGVAHGEKIHVIVNHWSSRREGTEISEPKRMHQASLVRKKVNEIQALDPTAKIIVTGDFNDMPSDKSISQILKACDKKEGNPKEELYNLMSDAAQRGMGTINHKGAWMMFDQMIVSYNLINAKKGYFCEFNGGNIFNPKWLMYKNPKTGDYTPNKTYGGDSYYGGYSDHLPIYLRLKYKK